jgi:hypothetical protein
MVNASNSPALASVLNKRLDNITQTFAGNGSTATVASQVGCQLKSLQLAVRNMRLLVVWLR